MAFLSRELPGKIEDVGRIKELILTDSRHSGGFLDDNQMDWSVRDYTVMTILSR